MRNRIPDSVDFFRHSPRFGLVSDLIVNPQVIILRWREKGLVLNVQQLFQLKVLNQFEDTLLRALILNRGEIGNRYAGIECVY